MKVLFKLRNLIVIALVLQLFAIPAYAMEVHEVQEQRAPIHYLALGDSLAFGINSNGEPDLGYPDFLQTFLSAEYEVAYYNKGFSYPGYKSTDVLNDLLANVSKPFYGDVLDESKLSELHATISRANLITISAGANDILPYFKINPETGSPEIQVLPLLSAIQQISKNYAQILTQINEINPLAQVYVMGYYNPFPHLDAELQPQIDQLLQGLNNSLLTGIEGTQTVFVPTHTEIATDFDAHLPNPSNIHLSHEGYQVVAELFYKSIQDTFLFNSVEVIVEEEPIEEPAIEEEPVESALSFEDTLDHWGRSYVDSAVALGLVRGFPDGTFKPDLSLTRVQATSILVRALGFESNSTAPFEDITTLAEAIQADIAAAYELGIVRGQDGSFQPNEPISRAELAVMIDRAYTILQGAPYTSDTEAPFIDISSLDEEARNAITMLYELHIVAGYEGKFMPENTTTRAEAAKIFVNLLGLDSIS